ncbi:hypothetical protein [Stagnihabitans tardus]|uniref:Uncharacterized protein n=1 Tax=Stagnihabitans tardus TaxID=2699202 RepID=A0AAE4YG98_9RHOB|nr:hypothetical protein [Stagnihabitans tardus]NBZ89410.1 hypothetical protein [Stagnihabitans tardus]
MFLGSASGNDRSVEAGACMHLMPWRGLPLILQQPMFEQGVTSRIGPDIVKDAAVSPA